MTVSNRVTIVKDKSSMQSEPSNLLAAVGIVASLVFEYGIFVKQ